jgi:hypothetical protein
MSEDTTGLEEIGLRPNIFDVDFSPVQNRPAVNGGTRWRHGEFVPGCFQCRSLPLRFDVMMRSNMDQLASYSNRPATGALHSSAERRTIRSNTGCGSPGEADIAFSTLIVAACCSIRSPYSLSRCARSAERACSSVWAASRSFCNSAQTRRSSANSWFSVALMTAPQVRRLLAVRSSDGHSAGLVDGQATTARRVEGIRYGCTGGN